MRVNDPGVADGVADLDEGVTVEELQLAARNHGMPLEGLRYDVTPIGMHYLADPLGHAGDRRRRRGPSRSTGSCDRPLSLSMDDLRARPAVTTARHDGMRRERPRAAVAAADEPAVDPGGGRERRVDRHAAARRSSTKPASDPMPSSSCSRAPTTGSRETSNRTTSAASRSRRRCARTCCSRTPINGQPLPPAARIPRPPDRARLVRHDEREVAANGSKRSPSRSRDSRWMPTASATMPTIPVCP